MSTNFYAEMQIAPSVTWKMHLGKRTSSGLGNLNGQIFPSWRDMKVFLNHNREEISIVDENGEHHTVEDFIYEVEETDFENRATQYNYVAKHYPDILGSPDTKGVYWLDIENFTFYGGEFS